MGNDCMARGDGVLLERERRLLAQWLREWRCDQLLRAGDFSEGGQAQAGPERPSVRERLALGQIRLLHPADSGSASRPLFVAVFARPTPFLYRVAPFGRFATPAVPGELDTGRPQAALRVLCLWNARTLHADTLRRGWGVARLSAAEAALARERDRCAGSGGVPVAGDDRAGPRLCHPADPRHIYLRQESALMDRVCREGAAESVVYAAASWPSAWRRQASGQEALDRAAEGTPAYGERQIWQAPDHAVCLEVEAPGVPGQPCLLAVRALRGGASAALDDAVVVGARRIARILDGRALVGADDLAGGLRLYDRDGARIRLVRPDRATGAIGDDRPGPPW